MKKKIPSAEKSIKRFYDIILHRKGALSSKIQEENNKIARIITRPTVPVHALYPNGIDPADLKKSKKLLTKIETSIKGYSAVVRKALDRMSKINTRDETRIDMIDIEPLEKIAKRVNYIYQSTDCKQLAGR